MSDRNLLNRKSTKSLNQRHTAWYQLVSAAGSLLDRFRGDEVTDANREDLWVLRDCVIRVMEAEGMTERPDNREYDVELGEADRKDPA
jgi:hypothetical protein